MESPTTETTRTLSSPHLNNNDDGHPSENNGHTYNTRAQVWKYKQQQQKKSPLPFASAPHTVSGLESSTNMSNNISSPLLSLAPQAFETWSTTANMSPPSTSSSSFPLIPSHNVEETNHQNAFGLATPLYRTMPFHNRSLNTDTLERKGANNKEILQDTTISPSPTSKKRLHSQHFANIHHNNSKTPTQFSPHRAAQQQQTQTDMAIYSSIHAHQDKREDRNHDHNEDLALKETSPMTCAYPERPQAKRHKKAHQKCPNNLRVFVEREFDSPASCRQITGIEEELIYINDNKNNNNNNSTGNCIHVEDTESKIDCSGGSACRNQHCAKSESERQQEIDVLKSQVLEYQKLLADKQSKIEELQHKHNKASQQLSVLKNDVEQDFVCAICQEMIVGATTLQCSHTFCKSCIKQWVKERRMCPVCRKQMTSRPIYNFFMDNCIEKMLNCTDSEEKETRSKRIEENKKMESESVDKLRDLVKKTQEKGIKFLNIYEPWNMDEKHVFSLGIKKYDGKARKLYCELIGLTREFVKNAEHAQLAQACSNIGLELCRRLVRVPPPGNANNNAPQSPLYMIDFELTRERLLDFLDNDVM